MEPILDQIRATFDCLIWYPVVSSVLMLPDACGAVEFWGEQKKPRDRYIEWYNRWVWPDFKPGFINFDGSVVYKARNVMIHESTGFTRGSHGFDRILFMPPNDTGVSVEFFLSDNNGGVGEVAFQVTISGMMEAMDKGVRNWLVDVRDDPDKRRENALANLIQYRPNGHDPHIVGIPIIS